MVNEGDLNKINGNIWYAGDVTAVVNAFGFMLKDYSQVIFNAAYETWDSRLNGGTPDFINVDYDIFIADTADTKTNISYNSTKDYYYTNYPDASFTTLDEFNDSSVDTGIWDVAVTGTGSIVEGVANLTIRVSGGAGTATLTTDDDIFGNYANNIRIQLANTVDGPATGSQNIELYDGTDTVILLSKSQFTDNDLIDISKIDANNVKIRINGGAWTNKDISSLSGTIKLRFNLSDSSTFDWNINWIRYSSDTITSTLITNVATTASATITNAMLCINSEDNTDAGITYYLSADNGANYEEVTPNKIHTFTDTGTELKLKVEETGIEIYAKDFTVYEYLVKYNLY